MFLRRVLTNEESIWYRPFSAMADDVEASAGNVES